MFMSYSELILYILDVYQLALPNAYDLIDLPSGYMFYQNEFNAVIIE